MYIHSVLKRMSSNIKYFVHKKNLKVHNLNIKINLKISLPSKVYYNGVH